VIVRLKVALVENAAPAPVLVPLPVTVPVYVPSLVVLAVVPPPLLPPLLQPESAVMPKASTIRAASGRMKRRRRNGTRQTSSASKAPPRTPQPVRPAWTGPDILAPDVTVEPTVMVEVAVPFEVRVTDEAEQVAGAVGDPEVAASEQVKVTDPA